jgi:hypothetical protein
MTKQVGIPNGTKVKLININKWNKIPNDFYVNKEIKYLICEVVSTISLRKDFILQEVEEE